MDKGDGMLKITVQHDTLIQTPALCGEAKYYSYRRGSPGRMEFSCTDAESLQLAAGDVVSAYQDDTLFFVGYLFTITRFGDGTVSVVAYDALRYFKNKDTRVYQNLTADTLLLQICQDFSIPVGTLTPTGYVIPYRVENSVTLFDMVENALDQTFLATANRYIMHCDNGKIYLSMQSQRQSGVQITEQHMIQAQGRVSIDQGVYTRVRLTHYVPSLQTYFSAQATSPLATRWGVLQYHRMTDPNDDAATMATRLLDAWSKPVTTLTVQCATGDIRVRGGTYIELDCQIGTERYSGNYLLSRCVHSFSAGRHEMQLMCEMQ